MILRLLAIAFALLCGIGASDGPTKTLRFAVQGGLNSLDPYALNETFSQGTLANVMEGLIKRDENLKIVPGLAERWETARSEALALPPAQGRAGSTTARPSPPTTSSSRPSGRAGPAPRSRRASRPMPRW